jgi:hypothetical protein
MGKLFYKTFAVAAATATGMVLSSSSAYASPTVNWQAVSTTANWHCNSYVGFWDLPDLKFKSCIVLNSNQDAQGVLVVQNTTGRAIDINNVSTQSRVVFESALGGDVWCASSVINDGFTRGCFGPTVHVGCRETSEATVRLAYSDQGWEESGEDTHSGVPSNC